MERPQHRPSFHARPEHLTQAAADSATVYVRPATLRPGADAPHDGVLIMAQGSPRILLTLDAALRFAGDLADQLDTIQGIDPAAADPQPEGQP